MSSKFLRYLNRLDLKTKSLQRPDRVTNGSDVLYKQGHRITFTRVGVDPVLGKSSFKAFITAYNETWNTNWNSETVYGRIDPIVMFKNTERTATLGFKIPAADMFEAQQNLAELQSLIQALYPSYKAFAQNTGITYDGTITQSPLVRIQIGDLLTNEMFNAGRANVPQVGVNDVLEQADRAGLNLTRQSPGSLEGGLPFVGEGVSSWTDDMGALAYIRNLTVNYNLEGEEGVFECNFDKTGFLMLPKVIEVNMDFGILHEKRMGWWRDQNADGDEATFVWGGNSTAVGATYPYGVPLERKRGMPSIYDANANTNRPQTDSPTIAPAEELPQTPSDEEDADDAGEGSGLE